MNHSNRKESWPLLGGGLLLLANFLALSQLLGIERRTWKSQLADLSGWVLAISLIALMVYTQRFLRWDVFVEASLAIVLALGAMCGLPVVLLARYRRIAT